jgi:hypothetical protein
VAAQEDKKTFASEIDFYGDAISFGLSSCSFGVLFESFLFAERQGYSHHIRHGRVMCFSSACNF